MPFFDIDVDETRHYVVRYRIEADTPEQAAAMAEEGTTHAELELSFNGIINRGINLPPRPVPAFIEVEYDLRYRGGDYTDFGDSAYLPLEGLTEENIKQRFQEQTGIDPVHIVHYAMDELYDADGDSIDEIPNPDKD